MTEDEEIKSIIIMNSEQDRFEEFENDYMGYPQLKKGKKMTTNIF